MKVFLMIAAFMLTATTPLFAQMGGDAPAEEKKEAAGEDKAEDKAEDEAEEKEDENVTQIKKMFKGLDVLHKDTKVTQESIDAFLKHNASFDKASDADEKFEDMKDLGLVEAHDYVLKQEWFKTWATENEVAEPEAWLKNTLRILSGNIATMLTGMLEQQGKMIEMGKAQLEQIKEAQPEQYKKGMAEIEAGEKILAGMAEGLKQVPEFSDAEKKLLEDNAEAITKAMDDEDGEEEDGADEGDDEDSEDDMG
ncbi:hypothetical protein OAU50_01280 [Planctomycetota bacterium]|nr:hypothetical protein [Planctomycetota bacterium]